MHPAVELNHVSKSFRVRLARRAGVASRVHDLFRPLTQTVVPLNRLPAGFVGYLPVRIVRTPSLLHVSVLGIGAAAYLALAALVFDRGLRRYGSGSRFSTFG